MRYLPVSEVGRPDSNIGSSTKSHLVSNLTLFDFEGICFLYRYLNIKWGRSSAGRAPALQAGGQEFDSPRLHHLYVCQKVPLVKGVGIW